MPCKPGIIDHFSFSTYLFYFTAVWKRWRKAQKVIYIPPTSVQTRRAAASDAGAVEINFGFMPTSNISLSFLPTSMI